MGNKVKIKEVVEKLPKLSGEPVLLQFEHSEVNPKVDLGERLVANLYETERAEPHMARRMNVGNLKRKQVVVVHGDTDMTYIGTSDSQLNSDLGNLRTFIAVRDRKNKMRVYEATPITVSPYLDSRAHLKHADTAPKVGGEERRAAMIDLVKTFGSKKKRQVLERREKNQIDSEHMNDSINTATQSVETVDEIPNVKDETILHLAPPCYREATDIQAVYRINDILSEDDLNDMDAVAKKWLGSTETQMNILRESKVFSDYFFEMWKKLSPKKAEVKSIHLSKLVIYTELLICIFKLSLYEIRKRFPTLPQQFPGWLVDKALANFTTLNANNVRCRPETYKDKICCYIFVLAILANDFVLDIQLMSTSLQIHIKRLLKLARAVGATVKLNSSTKEYNARLRLPLPKPIEGRGRARKIR